MAMKDRIALETIPKAEKVIPQNKHLIDEALEDLGLKSTEIVKTRQRVASRIAQQLTEEDAILRLQTAHRLKELEAAESIKDRILAIRDMRRSMIKRQEQYDEVMLRRAIEAGYLDTAIKRQFLLEDTTENLAAENARLKAELIMAKRRTRIEELQKEKEDVQE